MYLMINLRINFRKKKLINKSFVWDSKKKTWNVHIFFQLKKKLIRSILDRYIIRILTYWIRFYLSLNWLENTRTRKKSTWIWDKLKVTLTYNFLKNYSRKKYSRERKHTSKEKNYTIQQTRKIYIPIYKNLWLNRKPVDNRTKYTN